ncbi:MAG: carotenoid cleavage dioxygenase [Acidimicrobiia bacterium]
MVVPPPANGMFSGPFKPMRFEATVEDCVVRGEIPRDVAGGMYRNGPAWKRPSRQGPNGVLQLDGMIQGLVFDNGTATFRNRWVRTPKYLLEEQHGTGMFEWTDGHWEDLRNFGWGDVARDERNAGVPQGTNGINVVPFAGELLAVGEQGGPPVALDPITLETKGIVKWSTGLARGIHRDPGRPNDHTRDIVPDDVNPNCTFIAHPKWDPDTGDLWGWVWSDEPPYLTAHVVHADGTVTSMAIEDAPYGSMIHDGWLTTDHLVLPIQPWIASPKRVLEGHSAFDWDPSLPMVLALVPRKGFPNTPVRLLELDFPAECIMHTLSGNVDGDVLTLDGPIFERPPWPFEFDFMDGQPVKLFFAIARSAFGRWTVDLSTGSSKTEHVNERPCELTKIDERYFGKPYRHGFMIGGEPKGTGMAMKDLVHIDVRTGEERVYRITDGGPVAVLEPAFAPRRSDAPEGDGYVIVPVTYWTEDRAEYLMFDTDDITAGPIATIEIPFHSGWTPHGHWMDFR